MISRNKVTMAVLCACLVLVVSFAAAGSQERATYAVDETGGGEPISLPLRGRTISLN